jgi:hypothetical protein
MSTVLMGGMKGPKVLSFGFGEVLIRIMDSFGPPVIVEVKGNLKPIVVGK